MSKIDEKYHKLLRYIVEKGYKYEDPNRKGIYRHQISSYTIKHNFTDGFPALTTKKLAWKAVVGELLWILRGDTNIKYLVDNGINIWNKDAYNWFLKYFKDTPGEVDFETFVEDQKSGFTGSADLGRVYGAQLRDWKGFDSGFNYANQKNNDKSEKGIDQLADLIHTLKTNPMATKKTVTFWNPAEKDQCALTPCHWSFEILVEPLNEIDINMQKQAIIIELHTGKHPNPSEKLLEKEYLKIPKYQFTLKWHQHSVDTFLGLPFNIASYALLAQIIGKMTNMIPKGIIGDLSNVHIYEPHMDAVKKQLSRDVNKYDNCKVLIDPRVDRDLKFKKLDIALDSLKIERFQLKNYKSYPRIPAEMLPYNN